MTGHHNVHDNTVHGPGTLCVVPVQESLQCLFQGLNRLHFKLTWVAARAIELLQLATWDRLIQRVAPSRTNRPSWKSPHRPLYDVGKAGAGV